jgi:hypothetical protein
LKNDDNDDVLVDDDDDDDDDGDDDDDDDDDPPGVAPGTSKWTKPPKAEELIGELIQIYYAGTLATLTQQFRTSKVSQSPSNWPLN